MIRRKPEKAMPPGSGATQRLGREFLGEDLATDDGV
jgi:hypothetical protein